MNGSQNPNQQSFTNPEYISGNPVIDNIKKTGQNPLFILASAIYIALPILQFVLNFSSTIPIQLIGVVGMILIVVSCNAKNYPGVRTAGFSVLKGYAITMIVLGGLLAASSLLMITSFDEFLKEAELDEELLAEELTALLDELSQMIGYEVEAKTIFIILFALSAFVIVRYAFVVVMCKRLVNSLRTGKNCGKIPVILAVFYVLMAFVNILGLVGSVGISNVFGLILIILDIAAEAAFTLVIFKYNNSLNTLWYS